MIDLLIETASIVQHFRIVIYTFLFLFTCSITACFVVGGINE